MIGPRLSLLVTSLTPPMTVCDVLGVSRRRRLRHVLVGRHGRHAGGRAVGRDGAPARARASSYRPSVAVRAWRWPWRPLRCRQPARSWPRRARLSFRRPIFLALGAAASALIRVIGAVVGYVILVTLLGRWPVMSAAGKNGREMTIMAGGTIVGPCLGVTTYMMALAGCHEGVVTTILATIPVMILPFSVFLYGERVSPLRPGRRRSRPPASPC